MPSMHHSFSRIAILLLPFLLSVGVKAQEKYVHWLDLDASPGVTLHTAPFFRGENAEGHTFGSMIHGSLRWSIAPGVSSPTACLWPGLRMGVGFRALTLYRPSLTGSPVGLFIFQGADLARITRRLSLGYEWQFGATAPWQILSSHHPEQAINGSPFCALMGASLLLRYAPDRDWIFTAGFDLAHYSNGNTRWPNAGTNTAGLRLGVSRRIGSSGRLWSLEPDDTLSFSSLSRRERWGLDIMAFGAWRKKCYHDLDNNPLPLPGSFGVAGINIAPTYRLSRRFSAGPEVDLVYDESAVPEWAIIETFPGDCPYYLRPGFMRQTALGVAAQAEYAIPVFALHISVGYNLLAGCKELHYFYQTLSLRTYITGRMWLNVGYSLRNFAHPRHLMLGIGIRLGGTPSPLPLSRL